MLIVGLMDLYYIDLWIREQFRSILTVQSRIYYARNSITVAYHISYLWSLCITAFRFRTPPVSKPLRAIYLSAFKGLIAALSLNTARIDLLIYKKSSL
jgi:hypothetical protein